MGTNKMLLFILIILFVCNPLPVRAAENWAYELSDEAKEIYAKKKTQIACAGIDDLLRNNDTSGLYIAIRDAALFEVRTCDKHIKKNLDQLKKLDGVKDAIVFYNYKNGDVAGLKLLAQSFDKDARRVGDHWTVELFGFLNEWEVSGKRLVRHAKYADTVGAEALCSSIMWRRYLYGEKDFKYYWFKIGEEEKVPLKKLKHFYDDCHP